MPASEARAALLPEPPVQGKLPMVELMKVRDRNHLTLICALQKRIVNLLDDDPSAAVELLHAYNGIHTKGTP